MIVPLSGLMKFQAAAEVLRPYSTAYWLIVTRHVAQWLAFINVYWPVECRRTKPKDR